jgi:hypothetical protein
MYRPPHGMLHAGRAVMAHQFLVQADRPLVGSRVLLRALSKRSRQRAFALPARSDAARRWRRQYLECTTESHEVSSCGILGAASGPSDRRKSMPWPESCHGVERWELAAERASADT